MNRSNVHEHRVAQTMQLIIVREGAVLRPGFDDEDSASLSRLAPSTLAVYGVARP